MSANIANMIWTQKSNLEPHKKWWVICYYFWTMSITIFGPSYNMSWQIRPILWAVIFWWRLVIIKLASQTINEFIWESIIKEKMIKRLWKLCYFQILNFILVLQSETKYDQNETTFWLLSTTFWLRLTFSYFYSFLEVTFVT